jgi:alpha-galactosidase
MLIDSCSGGGGRNDLETLRRAVPLLRSDYQGPVFTKDPNIDVGNQGHTYGLSFWVPYYGTGVYYDDTYRVRAHLTPAFGIGYDPGAPDAANKVDWTAFRRRIDEYRKVADRFYGDYYPLTPYNRDEKAWIAWQFHRRAEGDGFVQAFRRSQSADDTTRLRLGGLDKADRYVITDVDSGQSWQSGGEELMEAGLSVTIPSRRTAVVLTYERVAAK